MPHSSIATANITQPAASLREDVGQHLLVRVESVAPTCENVNVITLVSSDGSDMLPPFTAGAHVDMHLPNGLVRSYSLCNASDDSQRYVLGVLCDPASRGGSEWLHRSLKQGDILRISMPRNHFALDEGAENTFMISGGIGVTPILSMIRRLKPLGKPVKLLYCARSQRSAPFLAELAGLAGGVVDITWHFDDEYAGPPSLEAFIEQAPMDAHLYCCGPSAMLKSFESLCQGRDQAYVHMERFKQDEPSAPASTETGACTVELARSGVTVTMQKGVPVLQGIQLAGIEPDWSCGEGVCGACETKIIAGKADHRDGILNGAQRESNHTMMICVSCCLSDRLVLDL